MSTRGIDHLAVVSDDMALAMDFYTRVMGFTLVHAGLAPSWTLTFVRWPAGVKSIRALLT